MTKYDATVHNHTRQNVSILQGAGGIGRGRKTRAQVKPKAVATIVLQPSGIERFLGKQLRSFHVEIEAQSNGKNELVRVRCDGRPFEFVQTSLYVVEVLKQVESSSSGHNKIVVAIHNANEFALCIDPQASLFESHCSVSGGSVISSPRSCSGSETQDIGSASSMSMSPSRWTSFTGALSVGEDHLGCAPRFGSFTDTKLRKDVRRGSDPLLSGRLVQVEDCSRLRQRSLARLGGKRDSDCAVSLKDLACSVQIYCDSATIYNRNCERTAQLASKTFPGRMAPKIPLSMIQSVEGLQLSDVSSDDQRPQ
eukprot:CAMPEP_0118925826 /NCGR_PEP_ID=MMETSP1169-20130426/3649_1 /TAXON_ID=36882 /ORGANISM="Pyramimonas obovata, Strain CCMP722" /LENGTH=308 /DNA_ID=CAMNT_0006867235 /DNA_START=63 /DNA_END=989 /DNA_ORIENTATION=-